MANAWSENEFVIKEFDAFDTALDFSDVQPPLAVESTLSLAEIAPWTNRVPRHEPWPRVMKQDGGDTENEINEGYKDNTDWVDQYDNVTPEGREPIGVVEGDFENDRGPLWRR